MGVCCNLFYIFIIFAFVQIQFRWKQDKKNSQWMVIWKGNTTNVTYETGTDVSFNLNSIKYGVPLMNYRNNNFVIRERCETVVHIVAKIYAPALSFHRISLLINDQEIRTLDLFVPKTKIANNDMIARFVLTPSTKIRIHHYYDSVWSDMGTSNSSVHVGFRSGLTNIYDVPFE